MTARVRIKFCGITRVEDALAAAALGVDAIGLVFTRRSRRFVDSAQAKAIRAALPPMVGIVALFMDDDRPWIAETIATVAPDWLQFHGNENDAECATFGRPFLKAVAMGSVADLDEYVERYPHAGGFLLDSHTAGASGGRGERFDWARVPGAFARPLVLAGGLEAHNVAQAIARVRPYGVDVSSGIESAPGIKDADKMRAFVAAVRDAEHDAH